MQIRGRQKKRAPLSPILSVLLLSVPIVFIFLSSVLFGGGDLPKRSRTEIIPVITNKTISSSSSSSSLSPPSTILMNNQGRPNVYYEEVIEDENSNGDQILRYAAFEDVLETGAAGPGRQEKNQKETNKKQPLSIRRWAELMTHEDTEYAAGLARNMSSILKDSPFPAFRFETKGCHQGNMEEKQFEFVLVNDSFLSSFAASADETAFAEHFQVLVNDKSSATRPAAAVVFSNLGNSAVLIAPQPLLLTTEEKVRDDVYGHCGNFVRRAPSSQIADTWRIVAQSFLDRVEARGDKSVWLSTAGAGIAWLHVRLDDRPKYYHYRPFAIET